MPGADLVGLAQLDLAVDQHIAVGNELLGDAAGLHDAGGLEQITQRDVFTAQFKDFVHVLHTVF
ncbi:hypothetical protein D3C85_1873990 [compost metagenome]